MKLGLLTYDIAKEFDLDKLIEISRKLGFTGLEFRVEQNHKHGVELQTDKKTRKEIKEKIQDAYLEAIGICTSSRFEYCDKNRRRENIETAKKYVELASDIGAANVRVFGNQFEPGADKEETVHWVGEALAELYEFSKPYHVHVLLEMHGDFNNWNYALKAVDYSKSQEAGLIYNCDTKDILGNSIKNN